MRRERPDRRLRLVSLARPAPGLAPLDFLRLARGQPRLFWRAAQRVDSSPVLTLVGFGAACDLKAWGENRFASMERQARRLYAGALLPVDAPSWAGPRLFGGFAFRDDFVPDYTWSVFYPAQFILPHFQLAEYSGETWLTINTLLPDAEIGPAALDALRQALDLRYTWLLASASQPQRPDAFDPAAVEVRYPMDFPAWQALIERATGRMAHSRLRKVVLARVCELRAPQPLDVDSALCLLGERYPDCYQFLFEPQPGHAFFGATPELLAQVEGLELTSMALAGSIGRGPTPAADETQAAELLSSAKERYEHDLVSREVRRRLSPLLESLDMPVAPGVLRLRNIQHLYTPVHGQLKRTSGILPILARLHPTPALGGLPRSLALPFIREWEPLTRGWYAAPVGWLDSDLDGAFAVAIRSAVAQLERAWLYAGSGIVPASKPQVEWDETALKFRPILQALLEPEPLEAR